MSDILNRILATKQDEVAAAQSRTSHESLRQRSAQVEPPRGFADAVRARVQTRQPAVIAELKKPPPARA